MLIENATNSLRRSNSLEITKLVFIACRKFRTVQSFFLNHSSNVFRPFENNQSLCDPPAITVSGQPAGVESFALLFMIITCSLGALSLVHSGWRRVRGRAAARRRNSSSRQTQEHINTFSYIHTCTQVLPYI